MNRDNTISWANRVLQIERTRWRGTLAGCRVIVCEHLDGSLSVYYGPHRVGRWTAKTETQGDEEESAAKQSCGKAAPWKPLKNAVPTALGNPAKNAGFPLSHSSGGDLQLPDEEEKSKPTGHITC